MVAVLDASQTPLPTSHLPPTPAQDLRGKLADHHKEAKKVAKQLLDVQQRIPQARPLLLGFANDSEQARHGWHLVLDSLDSPGPHSC